MEFSPRRLKISPDHLIIIFATTHRNNQSFSRKFKGEVQRIFSLLASSSFASLVPIIPPLSRSGEGAVSRKDKLPDKESNFRGCVSLEMVTSCIDYNKRFFPPRANLGRELDARRFQLGPPCWIFVL